MQDIQDKIKNLELELVVTEDILQTDKNNKVLQGKVEGMRKALYILTGNSYEPINEDENEE